VEEDEDVGGKKSKGLIAAADGVDVGGMSFAPMPETEIKAGAPDPERDGEEVVDVEVVPESLIASMSWRSTAVKRQCSATFRRRRGWRR
jgi:hypothetical protein